ncbi:alanine racemase [Janthinobacterium agaricidamnosum]|uniref:D-serine deaminase (D-serine dehydratase) protein n=1 Tax=Janthinobacterium agaricidamnosum NBRC 102515 = DSM 9628 TaxID=1349767 RepID=W0V4G7_9BURK|nr:alanine racemase [Janthinobacterium agaricidamnosum]CDG82465.1 D-serine deaminase (D-serine dehydratase) protein [Janthinobacterium agaricidamnosum NBRC 102515 = DSM 9628]
MHDPLLDFHYKGFPPAAGALHRSAIGLQGWNVLRGDLPLPLAVLKRSALEHNIAWMQDFCRQRGVDIAPHGKTSMSPQLFQRQLDAGAWGISFASVTQLLTGVAYGVRRCIVANQVYMAQDLRSIAALAASQPEVRVYFLIDSAAQLRLIDDWFATQGAAAPFNVLIEIGVTGGRTGCRTREDALALARQAAASRAVRLCGIECYEGPSFGTDAEAEAAKVAALLERVRDIACDCEREGWFAEAEVIISGGGSALFDLVAAGLRPRLQRPVRALLRSGCYVVSDHAFYHDMSAAIRHRTGCPEALHAALEVWASVQSLPEPGLAILAVGKRDISFDLHMPLPLSYLPGGALRPRALPDGYCISALNDQHAYLRWEGDDRAGLQVGGLVALGIAHPCTTFDKWRWMPVVDDDYSVVDAVTISF